MLKFERFLLKIEAENNTTHERKTFGRDLHLGNGLNIIVGENTSGKSTIAKCIYFALGMEQLIEGRTGTEALDKSVKDSFEIITVDCKKEYWEVKKSAVYVKLANNNDEHITIARGIKGYSDNSQKKVLVKRDNQTERKEYFLQARGDHNPPNGFYHLLAEFAGLDLQEVQSTGEGDTLLYMQIVFALSFIEQSRGWTDFFATMRTMNIFRAKQTLVEYALGIQSNANMKSRRTLLDRKHELEAEWNKVMSEVRSMTLLNDLILRDEGELKDQKHRPNSLSIGPKNTSGSIEEYFYGLAERLQNSVNFQKQEENTNDDRVAQYKQLKQEYDELTEQYDEFVGKYNSEKNKLYSVDYQLIRIEDEIKTNDNLMQVSNLITSEQIEFCPVCHQKMPVAHTHVNIEVQTEDLRRNIDQLKKQRTFLGSLKKRLATTIDEKTIYLQYYDRLLKEKKVELDQAFEEMGDNAKSPSRVELFNEVGLRLRLSHLEQIMERKHHWEVQLQLLYDEYIDVRERYKKLKDEKKNAVDTSLSQLENKFREQATRYGYSSHSTRLLGLNMDNQSGYCYFPVVIESEEAEDPVRPVSSSSDFVRCIWSYYIALLEVSKRHPGFVLMDEPCQHSMKEQSLRSLFKYCSNLKDRQVLLFCSSTPKTEGADGNQQERGIEDMLVTANLKEGEDYSIQKICDHSIDVLNLENNVKR